MTKTDVQRIPIGDLRVSIDILTSTLRASNDPLLHGDVLLAIQSAKLDIETVHDVLLAELDRRAKVNEEKRRKNGPQPREGEREKFDLVDEVRAKVKDALNLTDDALVYWSAGPIRHDGAKMFQPFDILRQVPAHGPLYLIADGFKSDRLRSPSWLTIAIEAERMIRMTGDHHHVFLEGIVDTKKGHDGARVFRFSMGS